MKIKTMELLHQLLEEEMRTARTEKTEAEQLYMEGHDKRLLDEAQEAERRYDCAAAALKDFESQEW